MCTVSVIALPDEVLRLAFNRDELLTRPPALPPQRVRFRSREAVMPIDPQSNGTWIAASDAGLLFALLNVTRGWPPRSTDHSRSRGEIIPWLLHHDTVVRAVSSFDSFSPTSFAPFDLLVLDHSGGAEVLWDGSRIIRRELSIDFLPLMLTSSGLGDELVDSPRRALFHQMITLGECTAASQDEFHRHRWIDRPYLSVCMNRSDARTVSRTVIELSEDQALMFYEPLDPAPHRVRKTAIQV